MTASGDTRYGVTLYDSPYLWTYRGYIDVNTTAATPSPVYYPLMGSLGPRPDAWGKYGWDQRGHSLLMHGRCSKVEIWAGAKGTGQKATYLAYPIERVDDGYYFPPRSITVLPFAPRSIRVTQRS